MRIKEHKAAVKRGDTAISAVAEHVWKEHHQTDWSGATVLAREVNKISDVVYRVLVYTEESYH